MTLNDIASTEGLERRRLAAELFRRGAACFEEVSLWRDAGDCWQTIGDLDRAAAAFAKLDDHRNVARIQMARGHYNEALSSYRQWLAVSPMSNVVAQVTSRLGIAACLGFLQQRPGEARNAYREARTLIDKNAGGGGFVAGQCWEALAVYGVYLGREDIISVGYERALANFGDRYEAERTRAARMYLNAVKENLTLEADIRKRLAEWGGPPADSDLLTLPRGTMNFPQLTAGQGASFGEWVAWRTAGKGILLTHSRDRVAIEIWADTDWFQWASAGSTYRVYPDGSSRGQINFSNDYTARFGDAASYVLAETASQLSRYMLECSKNSLRIVNQRGDVTITIFPATSQFQFAGNAGVSMLLGRKLSE